MKRKKKKLIAMRKFQLDGTMKWWQNYVNDAIDTEHRRHSIIHSCLLSWSHSRRCISLIAFECHSVGEWAHCRSNNWKRSMRNLHTCCIRIWIRICVCSDSHHISFSWSTAAMTHFIELALVPLKFVCFNWNSINRFTHEQYVACTFFSSFLLQI